MALLTRQEKHQEMSDCIERYESFIQCTSAFSYSIGLAKKGWPDVVVMSGKYATAVTLINLLVEHWNEHGVELGRNTSLIQSPKGESMPVYVAAIPMTKQLVDEIAVQTMDFYKYNPQYVKNEISFVQLFFPDEQGKLPFEAGFNPRFEQPALTTELPTVTH
ncbi:MULTISPECIES: DUF4262 domain-containing protein [unclassified Vibrio]|uniref:DUF4262 domain-containing protein n=1 Tax=unclassified Vibrio TaxID=2614977 RepID=UPI0012696DC5|nr:MULTISPECIES: DUF4262 domain-containing protein [unclassified Vibrio]QFT40088.1 hypothetical protein FIU99_27230 [Vibrio sp. THAF64]QGM38033.1 hypothetical protein GGC04_27435 [Vibrio sp. THAF191d]QGN73508.1 hypothetical protein GGC03_27345 [Vibrio sp. THAF191c]